jgi:hypothetical protein
MSPQDVIPRYHDAPENVDASQMLFDPPSQHLSQPRLLRDNRTLTACRTLVKIGTGTIILVYRCL